MKLGKVSMDGSVAAEDQSGRIACGIFKIVLNAYLNAAASEAIDYLGRHVWVKQRGCDHAGLCGTGTLACGSSVQTH